jgi:hypothetical protein
MIYKSLLICLGLFILLKITSGEQHQRKSKIHLIINKNTTVDESINDQDDYYDDYDYDVGYGYKQNMNKTFLYCFTLISILYFI